MPEGKNFKSTKSTVGADLGWEGFRRNKYIYLYAFIYYILQTRWAFLPNSSWKKKEKKNAKLGFGQALSFFSR